MLTDYSKSGVVDAILKGGFPFGIAMGYQNSDETFEIAQAFRTNEKNGEKILDVLVLLAQQGIYERESKEIRLKNPTLLGKLIERFAETGHAKMSAYLNALMEKQKEGAVGVLAIIISPYDVKDEDLFSVQALTKLEE